MKLMMLGAPGAGKGTQAEILSTKLGIPSISMGNILRNAVKNGTPVGKIAQGFIDNGALVPDDVILGIFTERVSELDCANGYILDGIPRTLVQAEALEASGYVIDIALSIVISDEEIVARMSGRRVCPDCGATFHVTNSPPKRENICDKCGGELYTRNDDEPSNLRNRLRIYHEMTEPLIAFYEARGKLIDVISRPTIEETSRVIATALRL